MIRFISILILTITLNPVPLTCQPIPSQLKDGTSHTKRGQAQSVNPVVIKALICAYAIKYKVEPATAMAVFHIESRKGKQEFRVGRMGKGTYYGPAGIHKGFLKKWPINQLETNIEVGVRSLARHRNIKDSLKKYNTEFNLGYWKSILVAREQYRKEWR